MKNKLLAGILAVLLCSISFAHAQDVEGDEPAPGVSITPNQTFLSQFGLPVSVPKVVSSSVVNYSDGLSINIEFESVTGTQQGFYLVNTDNAADIKPISLANNKASLSGTFSGSSYDIKGMGSDGVTYILGNIQTAPYRPGDAVSVSEKLYRALSLYVATPNQNITLSNYLKQLANVSLHEKISFVQRYIMNGATLPATIKGQYPDALIQKALNERKIEGECLCNFVMNQVTIAIPDEDGPNNYSILAKSSKSGPNFYNQGSFWFRGIEAKGPAKNQVLMSAGQQAGNKRRIESWTTGAENYSDNSVRIGYHLMCISITELPEACDCTKQVRFSFGYYSKIEARTNTGGAGCIFQQDASAQAQDWAVAFMTKESVNNVSDVQIFDSGTGSATSNCSGGVPVGVVVDVLKIGTSVFEMIKSVKTGQLSDIINQTNQIIDQVGAVLEQVTEVKECSSALIDKPLVQGSATVNFRPNDPVSFFIMSGSNLGISGRRCWESVAQINSSFHLAAVVTGGAPSPSTPHCCTDYFANWAYASMKNDATNRQNSVFAHLALNNPGGWQTINGKPNPGGTTKVPSEVGYAIGVNLPNGQQCQKTIPLLINPQ